MRVSFLYYEECPCHELALERLREVMAEEGISRRDGSFRSRDRRPGAPGCTS